MIKESIKKLTNDVLCFVDKRVSYGGPQVHSEFQTTLQICKHIPNSNNSITITKNDSEF